MKVMIDVTEQDIQEGIPKNANNCAIARVVKRKVKEKYREHVAIAAHISVRVACEKDPHNFIYDQITPAEALDFISDFDSQHLSGGRPKPFSFELDMPAEVLEFPLETVKSQDNENDNQSN